MYSGKKFSIVQVQNLKLKDKDYNPQKRSL